MDLYLLSLAVFLDFFLFSKTAQAGTPPIACWNLARKGWGGKKETKNLFWENNFLLCVKYLQDVQNVQFAGLFAFATLCKFAKISLSFLCFADFLNVNLKQNWYQALKHSLQWYMLVPWQPKHIYFANPISAHSYTPY